MTRTLYHTVACGSLVALASLGSSVWAQDQPRGRVAPVAAVLRPYGFLPQQVTIVQGESVLSIRNKTGIEVDFMLVRDGAPGQAPEILASGRSRKTDRKIERRWRERVNLPPGNYRVTVPGHPDWILYVTVTAN